MRNVIGRKQGKRGCRVRCALILFGALSAPVLNTPVAQAKPAPPTTEVWPGRRVVFLLPVQLSDNWNADPQWGQRLLPSAEHRLRQVLEETKKFSVVQPYRFDPMLQRALQEKRIDRTQMDALVDTPSLQSASGVLDKLGFQLSPLIAEFRLEEVRASGDAKTPSVQVQVQGKLYELNSERAAQTKVFTSDPVRRRGTQAEQVLAAAENAFRMIATAFITPPGEIELPRIEPAPEAEQTGGKKGAKPDKATAPGRNGNTANKDANGTPATPPAGNASQPGVSQSAAPTTPPPTVVGPPSQSPVAPAFNSNAGQSPVERAP